MPRSQSRTPAQSASARGTPRPAPRGARTAKEAKAKHRGGEWGRGIVARLLTLKGDVGSNKWAERVGLSPSLVSSYLNGTRLPGAESLRTIAERTGVSLDWLLMGWGGDAPLCRNQTRTRGELETDIGAFLKQFAKARLAGDDLADDAAGSSFLRVLDGVPGPELGAAVLQQGCQAVVGNHVATWEPDYAADRAAVRTVADLTRGAPLLAAVAAGRAVEADHDDGVRRGLAHRLEEHADAIAAALPSLARVRDRQHADAAARLTSDAERWVPQLRALAAYVRTASEPTPAPPTAGESNG